MLMDIRMRRARQSSWARDLFAEHSLSVKDLIWPIFVQEGTNLISPISTMPGISRYSIDKAVEAVKEAKDLGIAVVALFPMTSPDLKSADAKEAINPNNLICRAVRAIKEQVSDIGIMCDAALDPYTLDGNDGIVINNKVDNDATVELLAKQSLIQVQAGADIIGPSDMMDGTTRAIRTILEENDYKDTMIMSYSAKYHSKFYGPFRDAIGSRSKTYECDKRTYQMDYSNSNEAMREMELEIEGGADMLMVKPGMPYLDIIQRASQTFNLPIFAYQVSGEYAMLKWAAQNGCFDFNAVLLESMMSFKRAGAKGILTYGAVEVAKLLKQPLI